MDHKYPYRTQLMNLPLDMFESEVTAKESYPAGRERALETRRKISTGDLDSGQSTKNACQPPRLFSRG